MLSIYEQLLRLYPASYRQQFEDEMLSVFHELRSENRIHSRLRRGIFYFRELRECCGAQPVRDAEFCGGRMLGCSKEDL